MRLLAFLAVLGAAGVGGYFAYLHLASSPSTILPAVKAAPPPTVSHAEIKRCRDACEQDTIVLSKGDDALRACRARCEGQAGPPRPYEPIRSITRAPADHSKDPHAPK